MGRLDRDTTGLLLITNDNSLNHSIRYLHFISFASIITIFERKTGNSVTKEYILTITENAAAPNMEENFHEKIHCLQSRDTTFPDGTSARVVFLSDFPLVF